jgi:hypothetical protein
VVDLERGDRSLNFLSITYLYLLEYVVIFSNILSTLIFSLMPLFIFSYCKRSRMLHNKNFCSFLGVQTT